MKLEVVGSGSIFSSQNSASYLVDDKILIDIPNGGCKALKRMKKDIIDIEYIFITHFHGDHYFDLPFLLSEKYVRGNRKITLVGNKELKKKVKAIMKLAFPSSYKKYLKGLDIKYINNRNKINAKDIEVTSVEVLHGRMNYAHGYIFNQKGNVIGFTGDSCLCEGVEQIIKESNIVFIDTTLEIGDSSHMGIDNVVSLAKKYSNIKFITTHTKELINEKLKTIKQKNLIVGYDGMQISKE